MATSVDAENLAAHYSYDLPVDRIAQRPLPDRDASRLLQVEGSGVTDHGFTELPDLLRPGDLLVANDTRVRAARLHWVRPGGGRSELLILGAISGNAYSCLVRPARRHPVGSIIDIAPDLRARIDRAASGHLGARIVEFEADGDVAQAIERHGSVPLPPYIHHHLDDPERYQTVFSAGEPLSAAAPTAGLHFTDEVLTRLRGRGIGWATVSLEVGLGTFAPITEARVDDHVMHEERFAIPQTTARLIADAQENGGRVIAVGSTVVRTLETASSRDGSVRAGAGVTRLFIRPGHRFRVVDGMLTNFHQPGSSLLVMVAALAGPGWRNAYDHALRGSYRFLSFGDCMLVWGVRAPMVPAHGDGIVPG